MPETCLQLDKRRALNDGRYPIRLKVGHGTNLLLSTGFYALESEWDQGAQLFTGDRAHSVNSALRNIRTSAITRIIELRGQGPLSRYTMPQLRELLSNPDADPDEMHRRETSLGKIFRQVMETRSPRTAQIYRETYKKLVAFCDVDKVTFEDINKVWLDKFLVYLRGLGLSPNTQSIHLRNLRAVVNYAIDCDITANYAFRRFKIPAPTSRKRALSLDVLRGLASAPLDPWLHRYRDLFMLSFYLIGINCIDLCSLRSIVDGRVEYIRAKTRKPYSIKVEPEALAIIERYRGDEYLIDILDTHVQYRNFYRQWRRGLDAIRDALGLAELTTYWGRHSWATIAASLDIPKETIAAALGHEMGNPTTSIYIDFDRAKVDAANRRVIDYVLYGKV